MTNPSVVVRLLAASVGLAEHSGSIIKAIFNTGELAVVEKENQDDLQTEADRTVQKCIVSSLTKQFPKITVIGEEDELDEAAHDVGCAEMRLSEDILTYKCPQEFINVPESELVVWVDPLDGTKEFTQGLLDHVTVLIGLSWQGKSIGGVIHQPYFNYQNKGATLGRTLWGLIGLGAFGCGDRKPPLKENIITTARMHSSKLIDESIEACEPSKVLKVGGAGHKVLLLLDGLAHAYVYPHKGCMKWDTCGPEAILRAKGGQLTDVHGNIIKYHKDVLRRNSGGVLATLYSDHKWYLDKIPANVKETLNPIPVPQ